MLIMQSLKNSVDVLCGSQLTTSWMHPRHVYIKLHAYHEMRDRITTVGTLYREDRAPHVSSFPQTKNYRSPVPQGTAPLQAHQLEELVHLIQTSKRCIVLTGAGVSTESNIPDYRGPQGAYTTGFKPMTHQQFMSSAANRARYWARSFIGWKDFSERDPNSSHVGLARLQDRGWISGVITQNVDRLHHRALASLPCNGVMGSSPTTASSQSGHEVLELHGTTHVVRCLSCGETTSRQHMQNVLADLNPAAAHLMEKLGAARSTAAGGKNGSVMTSAAWRLALRSNILRDRDIEPASSPSSNSREAGGGGHYYSTSVNQEGQADEAMAVAGQRTTMNNGPSSSSSSGSSSHIMEVPVMRPDGDIEVTDAGEGFIVPSCQSCGGQGILKPDVVFFGDGIPKEKADAALNMATSCDLMITMGTSLMVFSAYRLVEAAKKAGAKIVAINVGPTRADQLIDIKHEVLAGEAAMKIATHPSLLLPKIY
ncbi:hypothetical protein CEUSTIGMA_g7.t1 [Chlamydomonas eustigma]|uniref:Deacetylase sirtuin-type domain-containing protein n=1 Tax=Chlamydomonas eustigma TaxID=1157962 RepID=A0A250WP44_9CHLO|nr:hypothetical protein CEUSTIGMA_g7.t1 [Chlamydomonas eustigma]|eukprot:GAX72551.1 hypothetical protein CEUSTIGMA_g7.t1 [Chlamydomonas eustigma]